MNFTTEFILLLKSRHSLIYVNTYEEERTILTINHIVSKKNLYHLLYWDFVNGIKGNPNFNTLCAQNPSQLLSTLIDFPNFTIVVLKDFNNFINDLSIIRKIKDLYYLAKKKQIVVVILSNTLQIPNSLKEYVTILQFPLPSSLEIKEEITKICRVLKQDLNNNLSDELTQTCKGLTIKQIRSLLVKNLTNAKKDCTKLPKFIIEEKKSILNINEILELCENNTSLANIGGLYNLKYWLRLRSRSFSKVAQLYGISTPKGLLLTGIQGTGKSMIAKAVATEWKLPLLKLDIGKIFAGIIGESEKKARHTIEILESLSPCILWIDEIDKAFGNTNTTMDQGTTSRVFSTFITWLSEKTKPVFVVATANNIELVPTEMVRKGRFDEIFFVDLPNKKEREEIFTILLSSTRPNTWNQYDIDLLSEQSKTFSGAEIKQAIDNAMLEAFSEHREFKTKDIIIAIKKIVPLLVSHQKNINMLKDWASVGRILKA